MQGVGERGRRQLVERGGDQRLAGTREGPGAAGPARPRPAARRSPGPSAAGRRASAGSDASSADPSSNHTRIERFPLVVAATAVVSGCVVEGAHGWAATRSALPGAASNPAAPASRRHAAGAVGRSQPTGDPGAVVGPRHPELRLAVRERIQGGGGADVGAGARAGQPRPGDREAGAADRSARATPCRPPRRGRRRSRSAWSRPGGRPACTGAIATGWSRSGPMAPGCATVSHAAAGRPSCQARTSGAGRRRPAAGERDSMCRIRRPAPAPGRRAGTSASGICCHGPTIGAPTRTAPYQSWPARSRPTRRSTGSAVASRMREQPGRAVEHHRRTVGGDAGRAAPASARRPWSRWSPSGAGRWRRSRTRGFPRSSPCAFSGATSASSEASAMRMSRSTRAPGFESASGAANEKMSKRAGVGPNGRNRPVTASGAALWNAFVMVVAPDRVGHGCRRSRGRCPPTARSAAPDPTWPPTPTVVIGRGCSIRSHRLLRPSTSTSSTDPSHRLRTVSVVADPPTSSRACHAGSSWPSFVPQSEYRRSRAANRAANPEGVSTSSMRAGRSRLSSDEWPT